MKAPGTLTSTPFLPANTSRSFTGLTAGTSGLICTCACSVLGVSVSSTWFHLCCPAGLAWRLQESEHAHPPLQTHLGQRRALVQRDIGKGGTGLRSKQEEAARAEPSGHQICRESAGARRPLPHCPLAARLHVPWAVAWWVFAALINSAGASSHMGHRRVNSSEFLSSALAANTLIKASHGSPCMENHASI